MFPFPKFHLANAPDNPTFPSPSKNFEARGLKHFSVPIPAIIGLAVTKASEIGEKSSNKESALAFYIL